MVHHAHILDHLAQVQHCVAADRALRRVEQNIRCAAAQDRIHDDVVAVDQRADVAHRIDAAVRVDHQLQVPGAEIEDVTVQVDRFPRIQAVARAPRELAAEVRHFDHGDDGLGDELGHHPADEVERPGEPSADALLDLALDRPDLLHQAGDHRVRRGNRVALEHESGIRSDHQFGGGQHHAGRRVDAGPHFGAAVSQCRRGAGDAAKGLANGARNQRRGSLTVQCLDQHAFASGDVGRAEIDACFARVGTCAHVQARDRGYRSLGNVRGDFRIRVRNRIDPIVRGNLDVVGYQERAVAQQHHGIGIDEHIGDRDGIRYEG